MGRESGVRNEWHERESVIQKITKKKKGYPFPNIYYDNRSMCAKIEPHDMWRCVGMFPVLTLIQKRWNIFLFLSTSVESKVIASFAWKIAKVEHTIRVIAIGRVNIFK